MSAVRLAAAGAFALLLAASAPAQPPGSGIVDTRGSVEEKIRELEQSMAGDVAAEKQAVVLRWLADLYVAAGDLDAAEQAFERILVFFPFDAATSNAFARFLVDARRDPERADRVLADAIAWADSLDAPPPAIGHTYALRARTLRALGRCEEALEPATRAIEMLDEDAAEDALRVRAACLFDVGRTDDARQSYVELIGASGGSNPDDVSGLIAVLTVSSGGIDAGEAERTIRAAIEEGRARRRETARAEGADIVELRTDDGVRLEGTLRRGDLERAVLFVPESSSRRAAYTPYAQLLSLDGVHTLTVDPRGHGNSRADSLPSFAAMSATHRLRVADDVALAVRHLNRTAGVPAARIVIVAAGDACGAVERAIHEHALPCPVVHLSPVFDPDDRSLASALSFRPPRPSLVFASNEDVYALRSTGYFLDATGSADVRTELPTGAGHGTTLLRDPARFAAILDWLDATLGPAR